MDAWNAEMKNGFESGAGSRFAEDDDDGLFSSPTNVVLVIAHFVGVFVGGWLVRRCCCRRNSREDELDDDKELMAEPCHLQPKKQLASGYVLMFCGGLVGAHHFYLERVVHGLLACWSLNFFGFGWLLDLFLMPYYVRSFNKKRTEASAPVDGSKWLLMGKLPLMTFFVFAFVFGVGIWGPRLLHRAGVVDIDRLAAQTEKNPYDVLEISGSADLAEAKAAYRKQSLKWHPDRNTGCGKECDHKMSEITKAFDLVKKKTAPVPEDKTWMSWLEDIGRDWWYVLEVCSARWNKEEEKEKPKEKKKNWRKGKRKGKTGSEKSDL